MLQELHIHTNVKCGFPGKGTMAAVVPIVGRTAAGAQTVAAAGAGETGFLGLRMTSSLLQQASLSASHRSFSSGRNIRCR